MVWNGLKSDMIFIFYFFYFWFVERKGVFNKVRCNKICNVCSVKGHF